MIFNMIGSNGPSIKSTLIISIDHESTVEAYSDSQYTTLIQTADEKTIGQYWLTDLDNGIYYLKATKTGAVSTTSYSILECGVYRINMYYRSVPIFSYIGGDYTIVEDDDTEIADPTTYQGNWKIRFLTSGILNFNTLYGAENGIDIFLVGGGGYGSAGYADGTNYRKPGGGGGGGYTATYRNYSLTTDVNIPITVGDATGTSKFDQIIALGGRNGADYNGGRGGSGGGASYSGSSGTSSAGGFNGSDGGSLGGTGGTGQGTTTREFGEINGTLYAGGGGGGAYASNTPGQGGEGGGGAGSNNRAVGKAGTPNTGGGGGGTGGGSGGGGLGSQAVGGSGIVIIRNAR